MLLTIDEGSSTVLISLDLSASFDTIDHTILLSRLQTSFGISGLALAWFRTYLEGRNQFVRMAVPRLQLLCTPRAFRKDLSLALCLFPYSSHPLHIFSVHIASYSSSTLTTLSSMSPYPKTITILNHQTRSLSLDPPYLVLL